MVKDAPEYLAGDAGDAAGPAGTQKPERRKSTVLRIVRDSEVSRAVKKLYDYKCQVCGIRIETPGGPYAEGAHIRPLGRPHDGSDTIDNILCLCPNHHVMFDNLVFTISDDLQLIGVANFLTVNPKHQISLENVAYHRAHRYKNPRDK